MPSSAVPETGASPASPAVMTVEALRFRYPRATSFALAIDHLRIDRGDRLFVHGPSGSGKSTLLSVLAGVLLADSGRVCLLGTDWGGLGAVARDRQRGDHVGYIFQQFNLLPWLPVIDNAMLACRFSRRRAARARTRDGSVEGQAARWLEALGLGPARWRQPAATLSVGEQQRVAAARALMGEPELLLADEPTSALDTARRDEFMALLLAACKEARSSLVLVSHDQELARHFDRSLRLGAT
jgi:putative ABC transport system ATP-binding protein